MTRRALKLAAVLGLLYVAWKVDPIPHWTDSPQTGNRGGPVDLDFNPPAVLRPSGFIDLPVPGVEAQENGGTSS